MPIPYPPPVEVSVPVWPDFLDRRNLESHKGTYGHALLVAGSYGKMGAAVLAAQACLRTGAGLLTVHVLEHLHSTFALVTSELLP